LGHARPQSRGALADAAGVSDLAAQAVLEDLVEEGKAVTRGPGFSPAGSERGDDPRAQRLADVLLADFLEPRGLEALGGELGLGGLEAREVAERAALEGLLERVKPGIYYHPRALTEAESQVTRLCERDGSVTIARLRDELGTSRKYAQALLEYFDSKRLTRRQGDEHILRRRPATGPVSTTS
jgi:selenocysteine-specific elongation factor